MPGAYLPIGELLFVQWKKNGVNNKEINLENVEHYKAKSGDQKEKGSSL